MARSCWATTRRTRWIACSSSARSRGCVRRPAQGGPRPRRPTRRRARNLGLLVEREPGPRIQRRLSQRVGRGRGEHPVHDARRRLRRAGRARRNPRRRDRLHAPPARRPAGAVGPGGHGVDRSARRALRLCRLGPDLRRGRSARGLGGRGGAGPAVGGPARARRRGRHPARPARHRRDRSGRPGELPRVARPGQLRHAARLVRSRPAASRSTSAWPTRPRSGRSPTGRQFRGQEVVSGKPGHWPPEQAAGLLPSARTSGSPWPTWRRCCAIRAAWPPSSTRRPKRRPSSSFGPACPAKSAASTGARPAGPTSAS